MEESIRTVKCTEILYPAAQSHFRCYHPKGTNFIEGHVKVLQWEYFALINTD